MLLRVVTKWTPQSALLWRTDLYSNLALNAVVVWIQSDEDEDQELQAEMFDPDSFYKHSTKLKLPQSIEHYINTHFHSCLSNSVRKAMAADNPLPNIPALTTSIANHVIVDYMGGAFPTKPDTQLKHLQSTVIAAAAPILNLSAELEEQEVSTAHGGLIPVEVVLECFQKMLVLLGNASNYMSLNCRDIIIRKISQKSKGLGRLMNSVCKESKPEGTQLFGTAVQKAITERAETMSALSNTASKTDSSGDCKKFFRGAPTSGYGSGSGKNVRPYNKGNQNSQFKNRGLQQYPHPPHTTNKVFQPNSQ